MVSDCKGKTHLKDPALPAIEVEIEAYNDDSHFSEEETKVLPLNIFMLLFFVILFGSSLYMYIQEVSKGEEKSTPLFFVVICVICEINHILFETIHLW